MLPTGLADCRVNTYLQLFFVLHANWFLSETLYPQNVGPPAQRSSVDNKSFHHGLISVRTGMFFDVRNA